MVEVRILNRTEFNDLSKGAPGTPSVMVTFQLPDFRVGSVVIEKAKLTAVEERRAVTEEISRMGKPAGETMVL